MISRQLGASKQKLLNDVAKTHGAYAIVEHAYTFPKVSKAKHDELADEFGKMWYMKCMVEGV
jgi:hypothetical protein